MDFKNSYRVEAVYFQKLKSDIDIAKSYIAAGATDEARAVLENLVDVDGAVLLLYRNIGECWAELANAIEKTKKELDALRDQQEQYHDELNEKIDEINNYIIRLINALDERLTAAEADIDDLQERMLAAESDIDNLQDRMTQAESDIDDLEANKQDKLTPGFGIEIDANNEISVDTDDVQEKLIAGQNITLTPDSTDPTKTVIDAAGGASITDGFGVKLSSGYLYNISDIIEYKETLPTSKQEFTKPTINSSYELVSANYYVGESSHENFGFHPTTYDRVIRQIKATFTGSGNLDTYSRATKDYLMLLCELRIAFNNNSTSSPHLPDIENDFIFNFTIIMGVDQNNIYCVERGRSQNAIEKYAIHNLTGVVNKNILNNISSRFDRGNYILKAVRLTGTISSSEMADICRKIYAKIEIGNAIYSE